ncbi:hypothetical protein KUTeg_024183 [Tegillarca granosa]|uniref:Uncharacterized protein n=1 Tax=Tegillarca granosa TaxID=220873 RepID=A0ABQ9DXA8_TEGGR|nr:hypothetical protein KUTeg_024183 [Tegillarca granosa]
MIKNGICHINPISFLVESQCTFPTDMVTTGDWLTSTRGTWHVESSILHNFTVNTRQDGTTDVYSFECFNKTDEGYYIIKSTTTFQLFGNPPDFNIYACLKFDVASATKLQYYLLSSEFQVSLPPNIFFERLVYILSSSEPSSNDHVCSDKSTYTDQERLHVAVAKNNPAGATTSFPCDFQASYSYHSTIAACSSSYVDICESSVTYNYSLCPEAQMFSMNGSLSLIFSSSSVSGSTTTYTTYLYNNDSVTPDGTTYYTFVCMLFAITTNTAGTQIALSVNPTVCLSATAQTSTYVTGSSGANITLTNLGTSDPVCATTTTSTTTTSTTSTTTVTAAPEVAAAGIEWIIIVIVLLVILLIVIIIIIICCCIRKRRRSKISDEEDPIADEEEKDDDEDEGTGSEKADEGDEDKGKSRPSTSKKYIEQEEDKKSIDSGFNGDKEDVSPVPTGVLAADDNENDDKSDEENETTKFVSEEPEREDETLNKDDNDEEEPAVKEDEETLNKDEKEEEENLNQDDNDDQKTVISDDEEEEPKVIAVEKGDGSSDEEEKEEEVEEKDNKSHVEEEEQTEDKDVDADDEKSDSENEEEKEEKDEKEENEQENAEEDNKSNVIITKEAEDKIDNTEVEEPPKDDQEEEKTDEKDEQDRQPSAKPVDEKQSRTSRENSEDEFYDGEVDEHGNPIRIGMKKRRNKFEPKGQLTNVLVTRDMEEKMRNKITTIETLVLTVRTRKNEDVKAGIRAEFMAQYEHKKNIEKELDEQHYWSDEKEDIKYDYNSVKTNVAPAATLYDETKEKDQTEYKQVGQKGKDDKQTGQTGDISEKDIKGSKGGTSKPGVDKDQKEKTGINNIADSSKDDSKRENGKDSGMETGGESPDLKQKSDKDLRGITDDEETSNDDLENMYSDSDDDFFDLPPGLIRDSEGRIIRESDGHVVSDHITEREYKKARLGRLFNIPRLKRSKKGRPIGGYIQDNYGPKLDDKLGENEDGPVLKHRRHSNGLPVVTDLATTNSGAKSGKSVMFDVDENELPLPGVDIKDNGTKDRRSVSSACRRLLKKRLFKQKRKQGKGGQIIQVGSADEHPRELNDLVKVYGRPSALDGQQTPGQPPSKYSKQVKLMDQDQIARNREGLARDKDILERLQTTDTRGRAPFAPREAFMGQNDNIIEEMSLENESIGPNGERRDSVDIGNEDEFVWVGKGGHHQEPSPFFTKVKHPRFVNGGLITQKSFDMSFLRHQHEKRHMIPWSLIYSGSSRDMTSLDLKRSEQIGVSKSAGASREKIDDRRLKELLEELYRDKKYFDHVVETSKPEEKSDIDERFLAEHGRDYLLDRAEYWEGRQPLPPHRPPATALGLRLSRLQTNLDSGRISMTSTTSSQIPQNDNPDIPGQVENGHSENTTENEQSSNDKSNNNSNNNSNSKINNDNKENLTNENNKEKDIVTDDKNT